jgi:hypothetical protein
LQKYKTSIIKYGHTDKPHCVELGQIKIIYNFTSKYSTKKEYCVELGQIKIIDNFTSKYSAKPHCVELGQIKIDIN